LTPPFLWIARGRIRFGIRMVKGSQEHITAQTGVAVAPTRVGATQADRSRVAKRRAGPRHPVRRSGYKAARSATSALAASMSAEDQMVQSCPEASPMKWHQAYTTWFFETWATSRPPADQNSRAAKPSRFVKTSSDARTDPSFPTPETSCSMVLPQRGTPSF
jgi:hypothetical protein